MKRLLTILIMLCGMQTFSQIPKTEWTYKYVKSPQVWADSIKVGGKWYKTFGISGTLTNGYIPYTTGTNVMSNSPLQTNGTLVGIGIAPATYTLNVNGTVNAVGELSASNVETNTTSLTTRLGYQSGFTEDETAVKYNIFIGNRAGYKTSSGYYNTFLGTSAGDGNTTGYYNTFLGYRTGYANIDGHGNVFIGNNSGVQNISGNNNTLLGYNSGALTPLGSSNVFLGQGAGSYETGSNKLFIDNQARTNEATARLNSLIYGIFDATPANQRLTVNGIFDAQNVETNITSLTTRLGYQSGKSENETTQRYNVFIGNQCGYSNTTGYNNVFIGNQCGYSNTTSFSNTFVGSQAGINNTTGYANNFIGLQSGYFNTVGLYNSFIGTQSGYSNNVGERNTFIGNQCGYSNTTGYSNVFIGFWSGYYHKYGSSNVYIGNSSRYYGVNKSNEIVIDNQARGTSANDSTLVETSAIIYGKFNASYTAQSLRFNSQTVVNGTLNFGADIGTTDDYAATITGISAYQTGMIAYVKVATANTGACTLNINSLGAKSLKIKTDQDPTDSYIKPGTIIHAIYDGTNFQMLQPNAN